MFTKALTIFVCLLLVVFGGSRSAWSQEIGCTPPIPPFLPSDPRDMQAYADLLRQDFETYIADFEAYLRCLDAERTRAFKEAQAVSRDYVRFHDLMRRLGPALTQD